MPGTVPAVPARVAAYFSRYVACFLAVPARVASYIFAVTPTGVLAMLAGCIFSLSVAYFLLAMPTSVVG